MQKQICIMIYLFFISGYGLMWGYKNKANYLNGFLKKRLLPVMIPYWIVNLSEIVFLLLQGKKYSSMDYVLSILGFDTVSSCWFVASILIMYCLFWIAFTFFEKDPASVLVLMVAAYCALFTIVGLHSSYTASVGAFLLGVYWERFETNMISIIRKHYVVSLVVSISLFGGLFFGRLILADNGIEHVLIHLVLRNLCSIAYVLVIVVITQKLYLPSRIFEFLGENSYEIYLVQTLTIPILAFINNEIGIIVAFALTILMGWWLHLACERLKTMIFP